jgi:hypothetical protein
LLLKRSILGLTGLALCVALTGCANAGSSSASGPPSAASMHVASLPATMPDVIGQPAGRAAAPLQEAGGKVTLVIPAQRLSAVDASPAPRIDIASQTVVLPEVRLAYDSARRWPHVVTSQTPTPGAPLTAGEAINLTAGRHPGGNVNRPWLWEHQQVMKDEGTAACFECHTESACVDCHVSVGVAKRGR